MAAVREALRASDLFRDLPDDDLDRLATLVEPVHVDEGEPLVSEGDPGDALFVIASGELDVVRGAGADELPLARVGPGSIQGEMALLENRPRNATVRAVTPVEALRLPRAALFELLETRPEAALAMIRTTLGRLRSTEALLGQREKLASLGTLAAGLAHELNNPAAAIRRSVEALGDQLEERNRAAEALAAADAPRLAGLVSARPGGDVPTGAMQRADRTDAMADLLGTLGASDPDASAAGLVAAGWTPDEVERALSPYRDDAIDAAIAWMESVATARALVGEVTMAATRISEIVRATKGYAYLDQAPVQRVDVCEGIADTLVILRHRLKGIDLGRDYDPALPPIEAYGRRAQPGVDQPASTTPSTPRPGRARDGLATRRVDDGGGRGRICDDGPGIPPADVARDLGALLHHQADGHGSGLGLDIARRTSSSATAARSRSSRGPATPASPSACRW